MNDAKPHKTSGFTIVELLVVIVVIGILAAITIVSYAGISQRATIATLQSDLTNSASKLKLYYAEHGVYPDSPLSNNCPSGVVNPIDAKYCLIPSPGNTFTYTSLSPYSTFTLIATNASGSISYKITNSTSPVAYNPVTCTGGNVTTDGSYTVRTFNISSNLICTGGTIDSAEVLVIAGGGGGWSGGGGAGGYKTDVESITGTIAVVVGGKGIGGKTSTNTYPTQGGNSSFGSLVATGGGNGGDANNNWGVAGTGGSGGGAGSGTVTIGLASPIGQGNNGGNGAQYSAGGGGGAGTVGGTAPSGYDGGQGGTGIWNDISGTNTEYAGGGGGAGEWSYPGVGGSASGGGGTGSSQGTGSPATPNTGGGGGGARAGLYFGGDGGSGVVIIRYLTP